jgi:hypothetical protein
MTTKPTKDAHEADDKGLNPPGDALSPNYITVLDGTNPVYIRPSAVDAIHGLGRPADDGLPTAWRIVLRSGATFIVTGVELAKTQVLQALSE